MAESDKKRADDEELINKDRPLYVISVAAELVDMHPQTLRLYERKGLIEPSRSPGKTRLYSQRDIERLREIRRLTQELGVNLAGVEEIIRLRKQLDELQDQLEGRIEYLQSRLNERMFKATAALVAPKEDKGEDEASDRPEEVAAGD
jgi:MerR family transcriptional regulator/heat shock protein HspR